MAPFRSGTLWQEEASQQRDATISRFLKLQVAEGICRVTAKRPS